MKRILPLLIVFCLLLPPFAQTEWFKGNTHTHTTESDGDSPPETAVKWYRDHNYNFVVITDHNINADVDSLNEMFGISGSFIIIPGNEISASSENKSVHMNALNISQPLKAQNEKTIVATLQRNIDLIRDAEGIVQICHPNFTWAFGSEELLQVHGYYLLEIYNFHPIVNNWGGGGMTSTEEIWDVLLSRGKKVYGVASDDTHSFKVFSPDHANPGKGWVCVRCDALTVENVISALSKGDFYFSSGVELNDIRVTEKSLTVDIKPSKNVKYTIEFIGKDGLILDRQFESVSLYRFSGEEKYVRARIVDSNGRGAWTQPVFIDSR
ncbi:CehA/McbA family metallohydrolase [Candidatus Latescibacterota bacterium]